MTSLHWRDELMKKVVRGGHGKAYVKVYFIAGVGQIMVAIWFTFGVFFMPSIISYSHEIPNWFYLLTVVGVVLFSMMGVLNITQTRNLRKAVHDVEIQGDQVKIETFGSKKVEFRVSDVESIEKYPLERQERIFGGLDPHKTHHLLTLKNGVKLVLAGTIPRVDELIAYLQPSSAQKVSKIT